MLLIPSRLLEEVHKLSNPFKHVSVCDLMGKDICGLSG